MNLVPSDPKLPFKFTTRQFLLALHFAMTIIKSQGQSKPVFTHGQLYDAVSSHFQKGIENAYIG
jgi:hypothetical protein